MVDDYYITNIGNDPNALRLAFEQKQIDELALRQKDIIEAVQEANPDVIRQDIGNPNNNLEFAYNPVVNAAFAIPSLAQAMFLAVDRAHVSNTVFQGLAKPNPGVNWPFKGWSLPQQELIQAPGYKVFQGQAGRDEDIAEARKLWDAGGGEDLPDETYAMIIVDLADQSIKEWFPAMMNGALNSEKWSVEAIPVSTLLDYNVTGQNPVGYLGGWDQWVSPDPRTRYASVYSSGPRGFLNFYGYHTDEMESYITKMFGTFDTEEAQQIMQEAQRFQLTDAGSGHVQMVGGVAMDLHHPYLHRRGPQFIQLGTLISQECWIDQNDPSFAGKSMPA
jgi:ABC-type transport system substrate-binding protein